jgi:hypothetical protein
MTSTEAKWAERVRDWRASGVSAPEYAHGRGYEGSTLRWWASRLERGVVGKPDAARPSVQMVRVVPASPKPSTDALSVRVGKAHIEVRRGFDRVLLRELIEALGGAS